jgi:hypothetical protein
MDPSQYLQLPRISRSPSRSPRSTSPNSVSSDRVPSKSRYEVKEDSGDECNFSDASRMSTRTPSTIPSRGSNDSLAPKKLRTALQTLAGTPGADPEAVKLLNRAIDDQTKVKDKAKGFMIRKEAHEQRADQWRQDSHEWQEQAGDYRDLHREVTAEKKALAVEVEELRLQNLRLGRRNLHSTKPHTPANIATIQRVGQKLRRDSSPPAPSSSSGQKTT